MTDIAIKVENLSKLYRIGARQNRHDTLRDKLTEVVTAPFRRLSSVFGHSYSVVRPRSSVVNSSVLSHRSSVPGPPSSIFRPRSSVVCNDTIWALKDVSFEVKRGEVVGIIGRNGAGKSTLLKILSRITEPTEGHAEIHGRVSSLLEVGTGFHPELTGRENIYLNGAILGMKKAEMDRKFDEIVAFAEIEKFLDTPVKRYSSGMYVRLAFAVAAHLEPEILLVDEVLAVGDVAFQKKCLGKMGDVAKEGRTVLFVSHNMAAVLNLCKWAVLLNEGMVKKLGEVEEVINRYLNESTELSGEAILSRDKAGSGELRLCSICVCAPGDRPTASLSLTKGVDVKIEYEVVAPLKGANVAFHLWNNSGICILSSTDVDHSVSSIMEIREPGKYIALCHIPHQYLRPGRYYIGVSASIPNVRVLADMPNVLTFDVVDTGSVESKIAQGRQGVIAPILNWVTQRVPEGQPHISENWEG